MLVTTKDSSFVGKVLFLKRKKAEEKQHYLSYQIKSQNLKIQAKQYY